MSLDTATDHTMFRPVYATSARSRSAEPGWPGQSASYSCRSSHSPSPTNDRKFRASSIASSFEFALRMANPPTTSLASANGPSVTLTLPPARRTRAPSDEGRQPSVDNSQPAFMPSSISFPIATISSCVGGVFRSTDLYILRNRIAVSLFYELEVGTAFYDDVEPQDPDSTRTVLNLFRSRHFLAQPFLLLLQLRRQVLAKVGCLKHPPDFDLLSPVERRPLQPLHRLFHRPHLPQPVPGNQFLGLGKGPVNDGPVLSRKPHPFPFRARLEPVARQHDSGLYQLFVELPHRGEQLFAGKNARFRILVRLHNDHDSHDFSPVPDLGLDFVRPPSINASNRPSRFRQLAEFFSSF